MTQPSFRYHPDPVATGSAVRAEVPCTLCEREVEYVYEGPMYTSGQDDPTLCLGCIADGFAAAAYDAEFTDDAGLADLPEEVVDEVLHRTPGFLAWQGERWLSHCGDAAAFLGRAGADELAALPDARAYLIEDSVRDGMTREAIEEVVGWMHPDGDATAYVFRCLHCGTHLAYWDAS